MSENTVVFTRMSMRDFLQEHGSFKGNYMPEKLTPCERLLINAESLEFSV